METNKSSLLLKYIVVKLAHKNAWSILEDAKLSPIIKLQLMLRYLASSLTLYIVNSPKTPIKTLKHGNIFPLMLLQ